MHRVYTFIILMVFWVVLSGKFDSFHLSLGVLSCALVTALSSDLLFREKQRKGRFAEALRFVTYVPWLLKEILVSTLQLESFHGMPVLGPGKMPLHHAFNNAGKRAKCFFFHFDITVKSGFSNSTAIKTESSGVKA